MGRKRRHRKRMNANRSDTEIYNTISEGNVFQPPAKRSTIIPPNFSMYSTNYLPPPIPVSPFRSRFSRNSYPYRYPYRLPSNPYWHVSSPVHTPVAIVTPLRNVQVAVRSKPSTLSAPDSLKSSRTSLHGVHVAASSANSFPVPSTLSAPDSVKSSRTSLHGVRVAASSANSCPLPSTLSAPASVKSSRTSLHGVHVAASSANACPVPSILSAPASVKSSRTSLHGVHVTASSANAGPVPSTLSAPDSVKSSRTLTKESNLSNTYSLRDRISSSRAKALAVYDAACEARKVACENTTVNVPSDEDTIMAPSSIHQDTEPSVNDSGLDAGLNAETPNDEEEDVIYLYSVEPEKGKLIEVVDLAEDSNAIPSERNLFLSSRNPSPQDETEMKQALNKNSPDAQEVLKTPPLISILGNKGNLSSVLPLPAGRKRKREENDGTHCSECHRHFVGVYKDDNQLFLSKCGHIFCMSCLRNLVPYKCTECNAGISNLCKVIF